MGILSFLFGKKPKIFNDEGQVFHQLPTEQWEAWKHRFHSNPHYNWKHHSGTKPTQKYKGFRRKPSLNPKNST